MIKQINPAGVFTLPGKSVILKLDNQSCVLNDLFNDVIGHIKNSQAFTWLPVFFKKPVLKTVPAGKDLGTQIIFI